MKLKAPEGSGLSVGFDGLEYEIKDGFVDVPDAATDLFDHGFIFVDASEAKPKKETAAEKKAREKAVRDAETSEANAGGDEQPAPQATNAQPE